MSNTSKLEQTRLVSEQASLWLTRLQEGLTSQQKQELQLWVDADHSHGEQLLELASLWDEFGVLTELAPLFDDFSVKRQLMKNKPFIVDLPKWVVMSAATMAMFAFVVVSGLIHHSFTPVLVPQTVLVNKTSLSKKHYQTVVGEYTEVALPDGSLVTLNTDTHITVRFTEQARDINLLKGEIHLEVYKDPSRPLSVMVAGKAVQAVGTAFSVRKSANNRLEVAVNEGKVAVYANGSSDDLLQQEAARLLHASLQAGDVLTIINDKENITRYDSLEMENHLAWKQGMIVFDDDSLTSAVAKLSRYSEKRIILGDENIGDTRVAGYFRVGDIDALLLALKGNFAITATYQDDNTIILTRL